MLGIRLPDTIPRATTSVESAADLVRRLVERGHAYWHEGEAFYDPLTYEGFGRLFGLDLSQWPDKKIRFRKDTYPGQRWNLGDFILWHKRGNEDEDVWWDTEIGRGRPAWNIQDAAMIAETLGFEIDIHTGGIDNLYRHHDYTLAIMEGASGREFCPWWLHGGHLLVDGEKMSKSRGNTTFVDDLLEKGFYPRHIRFYLLYGPYRDDLDLRVSRLEQLSGYLDRVRRVADSLDRRETENAEEPDTNLAGEMRAAFEMSMNDNLDYAKAFDAFAERMFHALRIDGEKGIPPAAREKIRAAISDADRVFGVLGCG
jgi:cysteinyl-tRNA synthetase